jgi:transcription antitermination factor NusG
VGRQEKKSMFTMKTRSGKTPVFKNKQEFIFSEGMLVKIVSGDYLWKRGKVLEVKQKRRV